MKKMLSFIILVLLVCSSFSMWQPDGFEPMTLQPTPYEALKNAFQNGQNPSFDLLTLECQDRQRKLLGPKTVFVQIGKNKIGIENIKQENLSAEYSENYKKISAAYNRFEKETQLAKTAIFA